MIVEVLPSLGTSRLTDSTEGLSVLEVNPVKDSRWHDFVDSHPDALIFHHPQWIASLEQEHDTDCMGLLCADQKGETQGVLPLLQTRGLPIASGRHQLGRRLSSLPRTPIAGPLATTQEATIALVKEAVNLVRSQGSLQLEIKSSIAGLDGLVEGLTCMRWRDTYVRTLPNDADNAQSVYSGGPVPRDCGLCDGCRRFRFGNARDLHQVKWAVDKAIKNGLRVRLATSQEELRSWYQLYLETMRRNVVPPRPYRFFAHLWDNLRPINGMELFLVEQDLPVGRRLVSGSIVLMFGQTVFWAFTGCSGKDLVLHPNDLGLWHNLHEFCRRRYRWYDLGEVAENHPELARFKAKWGTQLRPLYRYYYPAPNITAARHPRSRLVAFSRALGGAIWKKLPLCAIARSGEVAYRYL